MKTTREFDNDGLEALFAAARDEEPAALSPRFEARLLADAEVSLVRPAPRPGFLAWLGTALAGIGGAPGLAGMGAAGLAGVWIGLAGPGPAADLAAGAWAVASRSPDLTALATADDTTSLLDLIAGETE